MLLILFITLSYIVFFRNGARTEIRGGLCKLYHTSLLEIRAKLTNLNKF